MVKSQRSARSLKNLLKFTISKSLKFSRSQFILPAANVCKQNCNEVQNRRNNFHYYHL